MTIYLLVEQPDSQPIRLSNQSPKKKWLSLNSPKIQSKMVELKVSKNLGVWLSLKSPKIQANG